MGVKKVIRAVSPAGSRALHAASFMPGSTMGRVLCSDKLVTVPLVRLALERVTCKGCQAEINLYPEGQVTE